MTIAAKSNAWLPTRMCVWIGVTGVTNRSRVAVPVSFDIMHEKGRMSLRIVSPYSVRIAVACYASRVRSLGIVAARATFYILARVLCVSSTAATNPERSKIPAIVPNRFDPGTIRVGIVAFRAKSSFVVTCVAIAFSTLGVN